MTTHTPLRAPSIFLGVLALVAALLVPLLNAAPAQAENPHNCTTQVSSFGLANKKKNVRMKYTVWCNRKQERIYVTADILMQASPFTRKEVNKRCDDAYACHVVVKIKNPRGRQKFRGTAYDCLEGVPSCVTMAIPYRGSIVEMREMNCSGKCHNGGQFIRKTF